MWGEGGVRLYTVVEIRSMCLGHVVKWRSPRGKWAVGGDTALTSLLTSPNSLPLFHNFQVYSRFFLFLLVFYAW